MENREKLSGCEEIIYSILLKSDHDLILSEIKEQTEETFGKVWTIQTIATFLERMKKKEYVSQYRIGRFSHYHPEVSLEDYRKEKFWEMRELLAFKNYKEMADFVKNM